MRPDLPTGIVTFLFTDVEGSTRLLHELGAEAYAAALAEHRRLIRVACASHGGVEVDTQGDPFFFAFPTAPGALSAAGEMTAALASGPIHVRIGLHTGTPLVTEEGYIGDDVHFGARVAASSHGGQVVLSRTTAELVQLPLADLGEHRLKDIPDPVPIFQLGDGHFPPLKTISNTNLPRPASSFVGRESELADVLAKIEAGARLLTLTGPGGSGKTRLAIEAAASLVPEYKAGVFWVALAALRDAALVTETIAQILGAKDGLQEHIAERELLLLVDNLEQVIEVAPELSSLLSACPNLTLLVTSRELLRVQGEVEYPVPPLAEPEAVSLFCERAQVEPSVGIRELCIRLDSLPLAVELAAARAKALSPAQILERLAQRLDLLKGGRDADPRQQTLRATIEWSYDLLLDDEQQLLARLSVFAGGCRLEAAEEVCNADLDTLQSLVEKSLLRHSNERYWMLETIREYALELLSESGGTTGMQRAHADHYALLVEEASPHLRRGEQAVWLGRLEYEYSNLRAALEWLSVAGAPDEYLSLTSALGNFWVVRGHVREGRAHLEKALEVSSVRNATREKALQGAIDLAEIQADYNRSAQLAAERLALSRELGNASGESIALRCLGNAAVANGDFETGTRLYEECLEIARGLDDASVLIHSLGNFGNLFLQSGDLKRAQSLFEESVTLCIQEGAKDGIVVGRINLGTVALHQGDQQRAHRQFSQGTELAQEIGFKEGLSYGLEGLGWVWAERGDSDRAARVLGTAEAIRRELGASLEGFEQKLHEKVLGRLLVDLGEKGLASAWEEERPSVNRAPSSSH